MDPFLVDIITKLLELVAFTASPLSVVGLAAVYTALIPTGKRVRFARRILNIVAMNVGHAKNREGDSL